MLPTISAMAVETQKTVEKDLKVWRYEELRALGVPPDDAIPLSEITDVVASAVRLIKQGCPPELVSAILRD